MIATTCCWRAGNGWTSPLPQPDDRASLVIATADNGALDAAAASGADPLGEQPVGAERLVERSFGNVLQELDGRSPLGVFEDYLGELAVGLPANASLLPLLVSDPDDMTVPRTALQIHDDGTMTLSGDIAQGASARVLRSSASALTHAAEIAAKEARLDGDEFVLANSGFGRRLVLGEHVEDELDAVVGAFDVGTVVMGCWTYGAWLPTGDGEPRRNEVRDQSMTIATLRERGATNERPNDGS